MQWDPAEIGRFGFKVGRTFEMSWFTLWRRDDHYDLDLFIMGDDDDPVKTTTPVSFEDGDRVITCAYDDGELDTWDEDYNAETDDDDPFTWSLDLAALDAKILFISHGKGGIPPKEKFARVVAAVRQLAPEFGAGFEECA